MSLLISQIINGLSNSAVIFLMAIGLVIIFGMLNVVNMAHGEFIMIGAYCGFTCMKYLKLPFGIAVILAFLFTAAFGVFIEHVLIRKLYGKKAETLLTTFALTYILQQIIRQIFGPEDQLVNIPIKGSVEYGKITIPYYNIFLVFMAIIVLLGTLALFYKTKFGIQLRAVTKNRQMAQCLGIDSAIIDKITFAYGCGLGGLAGVLISPVKSVTPCMGTSYVIDSFMVVVLGGLNSIIGTFFGSFVVNGTVTVMSGYMSQITAKLFIFIIIIILIRFKPQGLFTSKDRR